MKNKNKSNNNKIISYFSFLNQDNDNDKESNKNEKLSINYNLYINIDSKNSLEETSQKEIEAIYQRIIGFEALKPKTSDDSEISKLSPTNQIKRKFLDKLFPKCDSTVRKISLSISSDIRDAKKLTKEIEEECINYFYSLRHTIKYSKALKLTKEVFRNLGYILCYIYPKFTHYSIKESGGIKECIKKIIEKNIDILTDYFCYCEQNKLDPINSNKTAIFKNLRKNYEIPPELIFLINMFHRMNTLDISIDFDGEILTEEDIKLFSITILNINYFLPKLQQVNLNFINNKLQFSMYKRYYTKIFNLLKIGGENIKKNYIKNQSLMYKIKWDFINDFNLEEYRKNGNSNEELVINKITYDDYSILCCIEEKNIKNEKGDKRRVFNSVVIDNKIFSSTDNLIKIEKKDKKKECMTFKNSLFKQNLDDFEIVSVDEDSSSFKTSTSNKITKNEKKPENHQQKLQKKKKQYLEFLEKNSGIFDVIMITICGVTRIESVKKLTLLSNDFYNRDLINYMINNCGVDIASIDDEFHILDMLYNKTKSLDLLNIEINSLDILSFDKIMAIVYYNHHLKSLKLSFFSADVSYFIMTLLKAYEEIKKNEEIAEYVIKEGKSFNIDNFEKKIVDDICTFFIDNLNLLFEIIKKKHNLEVIGFNFDLPNILINNMNYQIPIFKFLLNILIWIDNNEFYDKNSITKLTLLSPYTTFDSRADKNTDLIFKDINIYKNSKTLKELNIQFKLYNMSYIKNIISPNLIILSIGDLDIISFNNLVNYLTSYYFSSKSVLTNLNIKLLSKITYFNTELKNILRKLFNIKIKSLLKLTLFTNFIIENKANYSYLLKILNHNWIPTYTIILNENENTEGIIEHFSQKDISFLVSSSIENIISKKTQIKRKEINYQNNDKDEEIYWILKYIFICKYANHSLNFFEVKNLVFTILKYLYMTSNIKLTHEIEEEEE